MRTTLDIDDDVLEAVKELAAREKKTAGTKLSELARLAILGPEPVSGGFGEEVQKPLAPGDWPTFPVRPGPRRVTTLAHLQRVQDEIDREDMERALSPRR